MKKLLIINLLLFRITTFVTAQDTLIIHENFSLQINKVTEKTKHYEHIKTDENFEMVEYQWRNGSIRGIVEDWMDFMELEKIEYQINENVAVREDFLQMIDKKGVIIDWQNNDSLGINTISDINKFINNNDVDVHFMGYNIIYKQDSSHNENRKSVHKEAFKVLCEVLDLEIEAVKQPMTYWKLEIVDVTNASISYDQKKHWNRTETEEYIYYERIKYRRVADLLSRKLDAFVKPIPYNAEKFDIRMPYSDDVFDLKYAMIEHGLELREVTEEIEMMIIWEKE